MPLLEAMVYKIPLVASDIPVHREVAGNAAVYADPAKPEAIAKQIENVLTNKNLAEDLVANGTKRLADFSWDDVAEHIFNQIKKSIRT